MDKININIEGISDNALVASTLKTLEVFNQEISSLKLIIKEQDDKIRRLEAENSQLKNTEKEQISKLSALQNEVTALSEKNNELSESLKKAHDEVLNQKVVFEKEYEQIRSVHNKEILNLSNSHSQEAEGYKAQLALADKQKEALTTQCSNNSNHLLNLLLMAIRLLETEINTVRSAIEPSSLRDWIDSILVKSGESELKGLSDIQHAVSIDEIVRNFTFENSAFSDVATLLLWSENPSIGDALSIDYDWNSLHSSFNLLITMMKELGYNITYPFKDNKNEWLKSASSSANRQEQSRFCELFHGVHSFENGMPMFISSLAIESSDLKSSGNFIRYYKTS